MRNHARLTRLVQLDRAISNLPDRTLFHAGPPYEGLAPGAVVNAAAQVAVLEGWAPNMDEARRALSTGTGNIQLKPAQDYGFVVPLAQVASASTWCVEVGNEAYRAYSPVSEGPSPALRFGSADPVCHHRARDWCASLAEHVNPLLERSAVYPEALMQQAHSLGDDGHAQVQAGTGLLLDSFAGVSDTFKQQILANPGFSLTVWMAFCSWRLHHVDSPITAIGGNGVRFGLKFKGSDVWNTVSAPPACGPYFKPELASESLGVIGDSAVVDICGYGGQALRHAPILLEQWKDYLPADATSRPQHILDPNTGCVDPERVRATGLPPILNLAILHRDGADTPIGRGHYCPPVSLFDNNRK